MCTNHYGWHRRGRVALLSLLAATLVACGSDSGGGSGNTNGNGNPNTVSRVPDPETFRLGNAVAAISPWMTAWTLNDVMKTAGFENEGDDGDVTAPPSMWVYTIEGQWHMSLDEKAQIPVDSAGWPTSMTLRDGTTRVDSYATSILGSEIPDAYESGTYTMTWQGSGELRVSGADVTSQSDGYMALDYPGSGTLTVEITNTDPAGTGDYLRELSLLRPSAVADERFNQIYLDFVQPWDVIRPLHMLGENIYAFPDVDGGYSYYQGDQAWSLRKQEDFSHWGGANGAPYEVIVDLANQSESDLWLNLPIAADDQYLRNLAQLMLDELDSDRALYIELGNELWNWSFPYAVGREYALQAAQTRWPGVLGTVTDYSGGDEVGELQMIHSWQAARTVEAGRIFREVWGEQAERLVVVLAGQFGASTPEWYINGYLLEAPVYVHEEQAALPATEIDVFSVAAYVSDPYQAGQELSENSFDRSSVEAYLAEAVNYVNGTGRFGEDAVEPGMRYSIRNDVALAAQHNLPLVAYEGGHHFIGSRFTRDEVVPHEDMYDVYRALFDMWQQEGGGLFVHLNGIIPRGETPEGEEPGYFDSENFGIKETQRQPLSEAHQYRAVRDVMREIGQIQ